MTKPIEVITSVQRRRRWSRAEKERIVAAALEPGAVASEVARAAGIHTSQLFRWRQELCRSTQSVAESAPTFSAVTIATASEAAAPAIAALPPPPTSSVVEIEFASGARMRIAGAVDPSMASAMIAALTTTKRRRRR
jgi:transposase